MSEINTGSLMRLDQERDNTAAALHWCSSGLMHSGLALEIAAAHGWFWYTRGLFSEGRRWLDTVLAQAGEMSGVEAALTQAHLGAAWMAWRQADYSVARDHATKCLDLSRQRGTYRDVSLALAVQGLAAMFQGDYSVGDAVLGECFERSRVEDDEFLMGSAFHALGKSAWYQGDLAKAASISDTGLAHTRRTGLVWGSAYFLDLLATTQIAQGNIEPAEAMLAESLSIFSAMREAWGTAQVHYDRGGLALVKNSPRTAVESFAASLGTARQIGDRWLMPQCLRGVGRVALRRGRPHEAARLFGAAEVHRAAIGAAFPVLDVAAYAQDEARTRRILGARAFAAFWADGERLSVARAADEALALAAELATVPAEAAPTIRDGAARRDGAVERANPHGPRPSVLTRRERQIAALIGEGLTSQGIADRLVIAVRTVDSHAEHIREKLGLRSRAQIAAWAVDQGLVSNPPG